MALSETVKALCETVRGYKGRPLRIMEVCGTHTHENFRLGIRALLPGQIRLIAGPGCPVCVTPASFIDEAIEIAQKGAVLCTFGDLLRVPGINGTLSEARAKGAAVRVVYSPLDAVRLAALDKSRDYVFLSVGFETTTPVVCAAAAQAVNENVSNFSLLTANKTMPEVYPMLAGSADAFLYPGHVSAITGTRLYDSLTERGISGVVAGFTAAELLLAFTVILQKSTAGLPFAVNCYPRVVQSEGNTQAQAIVARFMEPCDALWRGLGGIPASGLRLKEDYERLDARKKYAVREKEMCEPGGCRCGEVLCGAIEPGECPLFGKVCTPAQPVGACMVSSEGACAAYYQYGEG